MIQPLLVRASLDGGRSSLQQLQNRIAARLDLSGHGSAVALGNFDGIHVGHAKLLQHLGAAGNRTKVVVSFYPHPIDILQPNLSATLGRAHSGSALTLAREKYALLARLGVDLVILLRFTEEFSRISAEWFMRELLSGTLRCRELVVGSDVRFGEGRQGDLQFIQARSTNIGISPIVVPFVSALGSEVNPTKIGSASIRRALSSGDLDMANTQLGRPYSLRGRVVKGAGRGSKIGFPTANIKIIGGASALSSMRKLQPAHGVYAGTIEFDGCGTVPLKAVANLGVRPTFNEGNMEPVLEAHILDYSGPQLYGKVLRFHLQKRLRGELKFKGVDELVAQIKSDIAEARGFLSA